MLACIRNRQVMVARSSPILVCESVGKSGFNPKSEVKVKLKLRDVPRATRQCHGFCGGVLACYVSGTICVGGEQTSLSFISMTGDVMSAFEGEA